MTKIRVGVLRGGPSSEYDVSLKTGLTVINHIPQVKYNVVDIFIDKQGVWHVQGVAKDPHKILSQLDVVFNALHGEWGEDGKVQHLLEQHGIPYTGSGPFSSAVGMNKVMSKEKFKQHGLKTPYHITLDKNNLNEKHTSIYDEAFRIFRTFPMPAVVKPVSAGSSVGVSIARTLGDLAAGLEKAFAIGDTAMIEELIPGIEATVGVLEKFRDQSHYSLPAVEIRPHAGNSFFDFEAKYEGKSDEIVPGNFTHEVKEELARMAQEAHRAVGLRHYSRSDFIVSPRRGIYILEVNTLPGLTEASLLPKSLNAVGVSLPDFLDHILTLAIEK